MIRIFGKYQYQKLSRVRSLTCSGQNLDSLKCSDFHSQDKIYGGDQHNRVGGEELTRKSEGAERCLAVAELWDEGSRQIYKRKSGLVCMLPLTICSSPKLVE
jgi:hypothetical protein